MDLKQIRQIVTLMAENDLSYFHFEQEGAKIELRRGNDFDAARELLKSLPMPMAQSVPMAAAGVAAAPVAAAAAVPVEIAGVGEPAGPTINSPMVGTFYRCASPEDPPFLKVGDSVDENTTVCIIEAMKVMNEIKADVRGTVTRVLAEDGKPVQYGQPLFELKA